MRKIKKILITGGSGFVGRALARSLVEQGYAVVVVSRRQQAIKGFETVELPSKGNCFPHKIFSECCAVVNLAGKGIATNRWNSEVKKSIYESRIYTTKSIIQSMLENKMQGLSYPKVLINASAIGYYGTSEDKVFDETHEAGTDFLASVCKAWETQANAAKEFGVRVVCLRFGHVLEKDGGMLPRVAEPFRYGVGGFIGSGEQWMSWIHRKDLLSMILKSIDNPNWEGVYNACTSQPVRMREFVAVLGQVLNKKVWTRMPEVAARLIFGEMAESVLLKGQFVIPRKAQEQGFIFAYSQLNEALAAIYRGEN